MKRILISIFAMGILVSMSTMAFAKSKYEKKADKAALVDWTDRTLGEESAPKWLLNLRRGNASKFKKEA